MSSKKGFGSKLPKFLNVRKVFEKISVFFSFTYKFIQVRRRISKKNNDAAQFNEEKRPEV